ncbi:MAG: polysaccharide biosynthesis C-terminal domain-containing protein [Bacteroidales bacterium]|nr:polysaccharide biosynthesis C-terminal domain-containing protein [Bacteroidales bacterium]
MGEIFKQSARSSIYIYLGVLIGFIITGILYPKLLSVEEIGLINVLIGYSVIIAKLGGLGMQQVTTRLFPYFRDEKYKHHGFLLLVLLVTAIGFLIVSALYVLFKNNLVRMGAQESGMFGQYVDFILPLILFSMLFNIFDNYYKVLYNAVKGTFYQEVVKRIFVLLAILAYYFNAFDFSGFVYSYVIAAAVPFLALVLSLKFSGKLYLKPELNFLTKKLKKEITDVGLFGILAGTSGIFIVHIDKIMVMNITDSLGATGVYSIAFFFGSLVHKPAKAVMKISSVFISEAWKNNRLSEINNLYKKSAINQSLLGLILLIGLIVNLDNIFQFLTEDYSDGRYVILIIAIAFMIDMGSGVNGQIINTSRYYRWQTYLLLILLISVVLLNWLLIPVYGITGAALATLISKMLFNLSKFFFIYIKWKMQPFDTAFLKIFAAGAIAFATGWFLPEMENYILDTIVRSTLTLAAYSFAVLMLRPSVDVEYWLKKFKDKYFRI